MPDEEIPVLIIGGSLVGLTTAMLLGHHGVRSLSVERHAGTAIHPRAGHFQLRTMETIRQMGLEDRVRTKSLETYSATGGIIAVESLAGRELATYVKELNEGVEGFSPTVRVFINQDALEPILRERAIELGATVRNRAEVVAIEQDDDGATATIRDLDSGAESSVRAHYEGRQLRFELSCEPDLTVHLDPDLFWRVFENLLDNAARFAPRRGRCAVSVRRDEAGLEIAVGNDGPPVPAPERERIFGRFYQVEARRAAARANRGLGLYFCKLAVEAHGGSIGVEERGDLGTVFVIRIPEPAGP